MQQQVVKGDKLLWDSSNGPAMKPKTIERKKLAHIAMLNRKSARAEAKRAKTNVVSQLFRKAA